MNESSISFLRVVYCSTSSSIFFRHSSFSGFEASICSFYSVSLSTSRAMKRISLSYLLPGIAICVHAWITFL